MRLQKGIAQAATHSTHSVQQSPQILVACCLVAISISCCSEPPGGYDHALFNLFLPPFTFSVTHAINLAGSL